MRETRISNRLLFCIALLTWVAGPAPNFGAVIFVKEAVAEVEGIGD